MTTALKRATATSRLRIAVVPLLLATGGAIAFIAWAADGPAFMPHGMCFLWSMPMIWSNVGADTIIAIAYGAIAIGLSAFVLRNRMQLPFHWVFAAFATFILACGAGHVMDVVTLWNPLYLVSTAVKVVTATASAATAVALPFALRTVNRMLRKARSADHYRAEAARSNLELARRTLERSEELSRTNLVLEARIAERTAEVEKLNAALACRLRELEHAYTELESDAAERSRIASRLDHLAHHDPVTALPNRVRLMERLTAAIATASRTHTGVLVIYLDVDHFKRINDSYGHAAGDRVLVEVGTRIRRCIRVEDTASRVGGDEFVLACATADGAKDAPLLARRLLDAIAEPMCIDGVTIALGASIGISVFPDDAPDGEELIAEADVAMYRAKQNGRNGFALYAPLIDGRRRHTGV